MTLWTPSKRKLWTPNRRQLILGGASLIACPAVSRAQVLPIMGGGPSVVAAVSIDVNPATSQRSGALVTTFGYTGLTSTAGANCIVALINIEASSASGVSVTWDSVGANQAFTRIGNAQVGGGSGSSQTQIWGLLAPASFGNKTITVNWTVSNQCMMAAVSLKGVNSTFASAFPVGGRTNNTIASTNNPSFNVSSAAGHIAFGIIADRGNAFSAPTGGTAIFTDNAGANSAGAAQYAAGAATVTFGWTDSATDFFGYVGCDVSN